MTENIDTIERPDLEQLMRVDGALRNALVKLGGENDVEEYHLPASLNHRLNKHQLEDLFDSDSIAHRVCTAIPNEMLRVGVQISSESLDHRKFKRQLRKLRLLQCCHEATIYAAIYDRGAGVILDIMDNRPWSQPVDKKNIRSIDVAFVGHGYNIQALYTKQFGRKPDAFNISSALAHEDDLDLLKQTDLSDRDHFQHSLIINQEIKEANRLKQYGLDFVHPDRVLWFDGLWTPRDVQGRANGSTSRLQLFWSHYSRYVAALKVSANILHRMEILNVKRKGYLKLLAANSEEAQKTLEAELGTLIKAHSLGITMSDMDNETTEIIRRSVAGIPQLIKEYKQAAIAASGGLTEMDIFGFTTVSGGLSNQDLRDRMQKAMRVSEEQEAQWREPLETFFEYWFLAKEGPTKGNEPDDWELTFPSALVLTPLEESDLRNKQATTDQIYVEKLSLPSEVVLRSRFGSGKWSPETLLPKEMISPPKGKDPSTEIKDRKSQIELEKAELSLAQMKKESANPSAKSGTENKAQTDGLNLDRNPYRDRLGKFATKMTSDPDVTAMVTTTSWAAGKAVGKLVSGVAAHHGIEPMAAARISESVVQAAGNTIHAIADRGLKNPKSIAEYYLSESLAVWAGKDPNTVDDAVLGGDDLVKEYVDLTLANGRKGVKAMVDAMGQDLYGGVASWLTGQAATLSRADCEAPEEGLMLMSISALVMLRNKMIQIDSIDILTDEQWDKMTEFTESEKSQAGSEWED